MCMDSDRKEPGLVVASGVSLGLRLVLGGVLLTASGAREIKERWLRSVHQRREYIGHQNRIKVEMLLWRQGRKKLGDEGQRPWVER